MKIPIPRASVQAWESFAKTTQPKNIGLIFDRFVPQDWSKNAEKDAKKIALQQVITFKDKNGKDVPHEVDEALLKAWVTRWTAIAKKANAQPFEMKTDWRFVTGVGRKGPLEAGFTFHRYGFPILPGSSVKGVARAYALSWLADQLKEEQLKELDDILQEEKEDEYEKKFKARYPNGKPSAGANLRIIFGTTADSGKAVFFDAIPDHNPELKLDIVNPHYPEYYGGDEPPTNWQSPIPSYFLTVAPGQAFLFAVGWKGKLDEERIKMAGNVLKRALEQLGAGAKTSAGYGYWNEGK